MRLEPEHGKVLGIAIMLLGVLLVFAAFSLFDTNAVGAIVLGVVGFGLARLGHLVRDVSKEVIYERDVLE